MMKLNLMFAYQGCMHCVNCAGCGPMVASCECGNEPSSCIKDG
jgi:hypothetical protein